MITAIEYLKKHISESNIPEEHYENEIAEMMEWYALDYNEEQVKNLALCAVSHRRELLIAYEKNHYTPQEWVLASKQCIEDIDNFLAINCG